MIKQKVDNRELALKLIPVDADIEDVGQMLLERQKITDQIKVIGK